jgi:hypothetical protein
MVGFPTMPYRYDNKPIPFHIEKDPILTHPHPERRIMVFELFDLGKFRIGFHQPDLLQNLFRHLPIDPFEILSGTLLDLNDHENSRITSSKS